MTVKTRLQVLERRARTVPTADQREITRLFGLLTDDELCLMERVAQHEAGEDVQPPVSVDDVAAVTTAWERVQLLPVTANAAPAKGMAL